MAQLYATASQAQDIGPDATARGVTVMTRPRPDFDPAGVRLPGFRVDASVDGGLGYDNNLLPGRRPIRAGGFTEEALALAVNSTWTRHALGLTATQATRQHFQDSELNWNDYAVGVLGRYDIGRASLIRLRYDHIRTHLEVDDVDIQEQGTTVPIPYDIDAFQIASEAAFNRLHLAGSIEYRLLRYEDVVIGGVQNTESNNDYNSLLGELAADYTFLPGRAVLGLIRLQDISYERSTEKGRDSFTWEVQGGIQYDLTGLWQARLLVGYRERDYKEPGLQSLSGPAFEGRVTMLPSQLTTLTLSLQRTIEESLRVSSVSYTRTALRFTVDHELWRNLIVTFGARLEKREYPRGGGTASDAIGLLEARLMLTRNIMLVASYQHTERFEVPSGLQEYGRDQIMLRLRFSL